MKTTLLLKVMLVLFLFSCSTVPLTGRKQLNMIPGDQIMSMSFQQYSDFLKQNPPVIGTKDALMVKTVGRNIESAVEKYLADNKLSSLLDGYQWEFNLVNDKAINAWCMPGGKVVVYSGILPITRNETGLAVVMGHEIAHAIAEHGNERMSQELLRSAGSVGLEVALNDQPEETKNIWLMAYGAGTEVAAILPYSRLHESEADHLGLIFMAMAGYNPEESVAFWQRMSAAGNGQKPPEFLSTHPSDQTRIDNLNKWMPEAMKYYSGKKSSNQNKSLNGKTIKIGGRP
ncbi:MAG: M48 family metallopeptidase [Bacteroidales bacterium]|nr:M48 family metallopeptidase [Bacteroidales bacterium]